MAARQGARVCARLAHQELGRVVASHPEPQPLAKGPAMPRGCDEEGVLQLDSRAWAAYLRHVKVALAKHTSLMEDVCRKLQRVRRKRPKEPRNAMGEARGG